jgi:hypothetical protein
MMLQPEDLALCLKAQLTSEEWGYGPLGAALGLSASQAHRAAQRAIQAGLLYEERGPDRRRMRSVNRRALLNLLLYGVRHVYLVQRGGETRGVPTAYSAPPLSTLVNSDGALPLVWPDPEGTTRGLAISPLYRGAPRAARQDPAFHELLALVDGLRLGQARERALATEELKKRLTP